MPYTGAYMVYNSSCIGWKLHSVQLLHVGFKRDVYSLYGWGVISDLVFMHAFVITLVKVKCEGKAVPLQAWSGPEGSRKLRFPDFMTTAQDGGKVVSLMHRPPLPPRNTWYSFLLEDELTPGPQCDRKNANDTIGNQTSDLLVCSVVP